jgi:hypothetical protein
VTNAASGRYARGAARGSVYDYVGGQLAVLVPRFGLDASRTQITDCYEAICKESLRMPLDARPPAFSRINLDGTPFQYAVSAGSDGAALQFLSEAGKPGLAGAERIAVNRECLGVVGGILGCGDALAQVWPLIDEMIPEEDPDLLADPAGAFWIGVGFAEGRAPQLKVYINAKWGGEARMWARLRRFSSHFGTLERWQDVEHDVKGELTPLGMAITFADAAAPAGRIYLSDYGKLISYYERLVHAFSDETFASELRRYADTVLREDCRYPTQSAVCSFGLGSRRFDAKLELCGHCTFASDAEAAARLGRWMHTAGIDATPYFDVLDVVSQGRPSTRGPEVHAYVGLGTSRRGSYVTIYLKPAFAAPAW